LELFESESIAIENLRA